MIPNLAGIILCGGESRRMGRDKGSLPIGQTTWAQHMGDKLAFLQIPVLYAVNELQLTGYAAYIPAGQLVLDNADARGPMKGILSVHRKLPERDLLLLACDMLDLDRFTLESLVNVYREGGDDDFFVYQDREFAQPLCGIYKSRGLTGISDFFRETGTADYSLQSILNRGKTRRLKMSEPSAFKNYNS